MQIPIISDIHGNTNFYNAVKGSGFIICLGDYAGASGKNHDSNRCIELLKGIKGHFLFGNHDIEVIGGKDDDHDISFIIKNVEYRYDFGLLEDNKEWLRQETKHSFKTVFRGRSLLFLHSYIKGGYFQYLDNYMIISEFMGNVEGDNNIVFVGHTHVPEFYSINRDGSLAQTRIVYDKWYSMEAERKYLVNVGSTGEPRDGRKTGTYALLDTENMAVMFREVRAK